MKDLLIGLFFPPQPPPGTGHHHTRSRWIKLRWPLRRPKPWQRKLLDHPAGDHNAPQRLLLLTARVQWLLERQIQLHRPSHRSVGPIPGVRGALQKCGGLQAMQAIGTWGHHPAARRQQKLLLVHRLIGAAVLEPSRAIRGEQQQRLGGAIRLHNRRQQIGDGCPRGGHHSHSTA